MLHRFENDLGSILINENIINETINRAIRNYGSAVRFAPNKSSRIVYMSESGVFVHVELIIRLGFSIKEITSAIIEDVADVVTRQLELPIDNVEVAITAVQSQKKSPRDILIDYRNGVVRWNE